MTLQSTLDLFQTNTICLDVSKPDTAIAFVNNVFDVRLVISTKYDLCATFQVTVSLSANKSLWHKSIHNVRFMFRFPRAAGMQIVPLQSTKFTMTGPQEELLITILCEDDMRSNMRRIRPAMSSHDKLDSDDFSFDVTDSAPPVQQQVEPERPCVQCEPLHMMSLQPYKLHGTAALLESNHEKYKGSPMLLLLSTWMSEERWKVLERELEKNDMIKSQFAREVIVACQAAAMRCRRCYSKAVHKLGNDIDSICHVVAAMHYYDMIEACRFALKMLGREYRAYVLGCPQLADDNRFDADRQQLFEIAVNKRLGAAVGNASLMVATALLIDAAEHNKNERRITKYIKEINDLEKPASCTNIKRARDDDDDDDDDSETSYVFKRARTDTATKQDNKKKNDDSSDSDDI